MLCISFSYVSVLDVSYVIRALTKIDSLASETDALKCLTVIFSVFQCHISVNLT